MFNKNQYIFASIFFDEDIKFLVLVEFIFNEK